MFAKKEKPKVLKDIITREGIAGDVKKKLKTIVSRFLLGCEWTLKTNLRIVPIYHAVVHIRVAREHTNVSFQLKLN